MYIYCQIAKSTFIFIKEHKTLWFLQVFVSKLPEKNWLSSVKFFKQIHFWLHELKIDAADVIVMSVIVAGVYNYVTSHTKEPMASVECHNTLRLLYVGRWLVPQQEAYRHPRHASWLLVSSWDWSLMSMFRWPHHLLMWSHPIVNTNDVTSLRNTGVLYELRILRTVVNRF